MLLVKDLPKMTNAQLQTELKKRGLTETGKKAELVERLSDAIKREEDAILNDSSDLGAEASLADAEALLDEEGPTATPIETLAAATTTENTAVGEKKKTDDQEAARKKLQRMGLPFGTAAGAATVTSADAKQKRAERFGTNEVVVGATSEDAKAKRAARFGITAAGDGNNTAVVSDDAKAKRAARFGTSESQEEAEKRLARLKRFGAPVSADPELDAKKKARAERFGVNN